MRLISVGSNRVYRALLHCLQAESDLLWGLRLLENVVVSAFVIASEVFGTEMSAQIVVQALVVNVEAARHILGVTMMEIGHTGKASFGC